MQEDERTKDELLSDAVGAIERLSFALETKLYRDYLLLFAVMRGLHLDSDDISDVFEDAAREAAEEQQEQINFIDERSQLRREKRARTATAADR